MASKPGLVVGLASEARVARALGWPIAVGGGTAAGARMAAERLLREGVDALVSFGIAGALDPTLRPGTIVVPHGVLVDGEHMPTDAALGARLGVPSKLVVLAADRIIATAADKADLFTSTSAAAVDMESGAVAKVAARHGIPFAVLRAICDPAERDLPPAAMVPTNQHGGIVLRRILRSLFTRPAQLPALPGLAADARVAHRALRAVIARAQASLA